MSEPVVKQAGEEPELEAPAGERKAPVPAERDGERGPRHKGRISVTAHDVPEAVQWHEGMLLAPQHFQQLAYRQEALLHYHGAMIDPYHWGVRHLKIDPVLLVDGVFRVLELEAVMRDGLVVSHFPDGGTDLSVDLSGEADRIRQRPLSIHLAVAARRGAGGRVDAEDGRFESIEGEPVTDENTGSGELRVPRLRPRLRLLATDDPPSKYVSLPLAEVAYGNETFTTTPFVPATLRVTPGSPLADLCASVASRLREKAVFLSEQVREPSSAVRVAQLLETRALVHAIVAGLPPFEALLHSGVAHPFALYLALCSLVGNLASVGRSLVPPVLEPYDHDDARTAFEAARSFIEQALREGVSESYVAYPFYLAEGGFFLKFDARWLSRPLVLGVRSRPGAPESEVDAWVEGAVIAAKSKMPELHQKRVLGLRRKRIEADADLVPVRGVLLYSLGADPDLVVSDELLEIRNPDDPGGRLQPPEIVLYVRR